MTIEVVPPICRSKLRTPAFCSSAILLMLLAPRATLSSSSIAGNFFLKAGLELLPQFRAGGNGNYNFAFFLRRLKRPFPLRTFALNRLRQPLRRLETAA